MSPRLLKTRHHSPIHNEDNPPDPYYSIDDYQTRTDLPETSLVATYGTYGLGIDLSVLVWPKLHQLFMGGDSHVYDHFDRLACQQIVLERTPKNFLTRNPVDLLVLGNLTKPIFDAWMLRVRTAKIRPRIVFEFWETWFITRNQDGPMSKLVVTNWGKLGYASTRRSVNATQVGGVVDRTWMICARYQQASQVWTWPELSQNVIRPMANCLRFMGVPGSAYLQVSDSTRLVPTFSEDAMPSNPGHPIRTERGVRRLLHDELCNGLGVPKSWVKDYPPGALVCHTVALHLLEYLSPMLLVPTVSKTAPVPESLPKVSRTVETCKKIEDLIVFSWKPPDLSEGSEWTCNTIRNLREACDFYPNSDDLFHDGMQRLGRHRQNYDEHGPAPTHLQLLWWEFPRECWDELREGCRMNFLTEPPHLISPNSAMTSEQEDVAEAFLQELVVLGVFLEVDADFVVVNAPMFCLPKPGQPGEWRILADMKRGGQNACVGADPTVFPRSLFILDQMYNGGWSWVVDMSKYFYNFPTHPAERRYLGVFSTTTGKAYVY